MLKKLIFGVILLISVDGFCVTLSITSLQNAANENIKAVVETLALGGDYKAVQYATPEGMLFGLDAGIEITAIKIDDDFKNALALLGNNIKDVPSYIPLPRLNITKGLPFGFDIGASYLSVTAKGIKILNYGGSLKYAILEGGLLPALAIRGTFNKAEYFERVKTTTYGIEALASYSLIFIEPFGGVGYQTGKGEVDGTGISGIPLTLDLKPSVSQVHFFAGATLKMFLVHLAVQGDFGPKVQTYSAKLSINF